MKHHNVVRIGKTERKILQYLAEHPDQLIKPLSKKLDKDYRTVHDAIKNLDRKKYLTTRPGKSKKGREYPAYRLSGKGVSYVLSKTNVDPIKVYETYTEEHERDSELIQFMEKFRKIAGNSVFRSSVRGAGVMHLEIAEKQDIQDFPLFLSVATGLVMEQVSPRERKRMIAIAKKFPKWKKYIKKYMDQLTEHFQ